MVVLGNSNNNKNSNNGNNGGCMKGICKILLNSYVFSNRIIII